MEQVIKDFGNLLGMQNLNSPPGKLLRLHMENLGDLDLLHEEGRLLMRLTKSVPFFNKEFLLNLLTATHYRHFPLQPMRPWFQKPDRIGLGMIFSEREATPDRLYQGLELLTKELEKTCA
jgi:hypothetical protein